jgi:hypothetical protein
LRQTHFAEKGVAPFPGRFRFDRVKRQMKRAISHLFFVPFSRGIENATGVGLAQARNVEVKL